MRNKNNRNYLLTLGVIALLLTGVYAILSANLDITGTATGTGDFKVEFSSANANNEEKATVDLNADRTTMTIDATLEYPGDSVVINFIIENTGNLAARVQDLVINENSTDDITINVDGITNIQDTVLGVGETTTGSITVTWNTSSTTSKPDVVSFSATIDYVQEV